jgi:5-methylcytosine-specific restriction protein A
MALLPSHRYTRLNLPKLQLTPPRATASERGYGHSWRQARLNFLSSNPLCVQCHAKGYIVSATVVDHIIPHQGDEGLFWDRDNWQALCRSCHSRKTASKDGGFGNRKKREVPE